MGLLDSHGVPRDPRYLGTNPRRAASLSSTGLSPSMVRHIQTYSTREQLCNLPRSPYTSPDLSHYPTSTTDMAFNILVVWADPLSLATTNGIAVAFSSCG